MKPKYEIDRRYPFEASADSVCPVPEEAKVTLWFNYGDVESLTNSHCRDWDRRNASKIITHFMVTEYPPEKHTAWVNVYSDIGRYPTKEAANLHSGDNCVACIEIEWTEGEGL